MDVPAVGLSSFKSCRMYQKLTLETTHEPMNDSMQNALNTNSSKCKHRKKQDIDNFLNQFHTTFQNQFQSKRLIDINAKKAQHLLNQTDPHTFFHSLRSLEITTVSTTETPGAKRQICATSASVSSGAACTKSREGIMGTGAEIYK